jgi:hypothetical protein
MGDPLTLEALSLCSKSLATFALMKKEVGQWFLLSARVLDKEQKIEGMELFAYFLLVSYFVFQSLFSSFNRNF